MYKFIEEKLANGISVLSCTAKLSEVVSIIIWIKSGTRYERDEESGYAHILEHLLVKGFSGSTIQEVGEQIDQMGAYVNARTGLDSIYIEAQVAKVNFVQLFSLLARMITHPLFDSKIFENEQKIIIEEYKKALDDRVRRTSVLSRKCLFGDNPLSRDQLGKLEVIEGATLDDIISFYKQNVSLDRITVSIVGDVNHEEITTLINNSFVALQKTSEVPTHIIPRKKSGDIFVADKGEQTRLFFYFICTEPTLKDMLILKLFANTLGYGRYSILKKRLRYDLGLAYNFSADIYEYENSPVFYISVTTTQPTKALECLKEILQNVSTFYEGNLLEKYKKQLKSVLVRKSENWFFILKHLWFIKKFATFPGEMDNVDEIFDSISHEDIVGVTDKYFSKDNLFITAFGEDNPFSEV